MEQLTQLLKDGTMRLLEVPFPALLSGQVLVRNHFSLISAGTEGKSVKDARLSYIGKARSRKDELKKVIDAARTFGIKDTFKMVMNKLDTPSPLGYSCAGKVIAVADDVVDFKIGDRVACGGLTANHSEVIAVPINLCVKLKDEIPLDHACFTILGSIALQGIRQADLRLGENCVVIGLGLVGQLTLQMLNVSGVKSIGIDIDPQMVQLAKENGCNLALERSRDDLENVIHEFTGGYGTDVVIITAGTDSHDPVDIAGALCRQKGKVIIVGAVPTGFKRQNYFHKELDLRMSCSYGAGRYDTEYEEKGIDYPYAYVRWTENRNMQAFADMVYTKRIHVEKLITHIFDFKDATEAYQLIIEKTQPYVGIILRYDTSKQIEQSVDISSKQFSATDVNIGMIGAGSFGQNFLLPAIKGNANLIGVATARPASARNIADKHGFNYCTGNVDELLSDKNINTVFIATRHDSHAEYVIKSLKNFKNVFVEKPLCLSSIELENIREQFNKSNVRLMVGFNRRFAPFVQKIKSSFIDSSAKAIHYRINSGIIHKEHWVHDLKIGGGRIIGEVCHFIDLCMFLADSKITGVSANAMDDASNLRDSVIINLSFANGSIANVSYFSNGNKSVSKEYIEVFGSGIIAQCDDFKSLSIFGKGKKKFSAAQDKGHRSEVTTFLEAIKKGASAPISFEDIYMTSLTTFKVLESIAGNGKHISIQT